MPDPIDSPQREPVDTFQTTGGEVLRMLWSVWGNVVLFFAAGFISKQPTWTYTRTDAVYWGLVPALLLIRYVDITRFDGQTANSEPATMGHWYRYALMLVGITALAWVAAQSIEL